MTPLTETFYGYRFTVETPVGREYLVGEMMHDGKHVLRTDEEVIAFIANNVTTHPELRITDGGDLLCMHVVDQELVFPIPERAKGTRNKWSIEKQHFLSSAEHD